eukprot:COSAG06_NODE_28774_length_568_cov_1.281450_2_plen_67_part_00
MKWHRKIYYAVFAPVLRKADVRDADDLLEQRQVRFRKRSSVSQLLYRHVQNDDDLPRQARDEQKED